jgi:hypothetical protein
MSRRLPADDYSVSDATRRLVDDDGAVEHPTAELDHSLPPAPGEAPVTAVTPLKPPPHARTDAEPAPPSDG